MQAEALAQLYLDSIDLPVDITNVNEDFAYPIMHRMMRRAQDIVAHLAADPELPELLDYNLDTDTEVETSAEEPQTPRLRRPGYDELE